VYATKAPNKADMPYDVTTPFSTSLWMLILYIFVLVYITMYAFELLKHRRPTKPPVFGMLVDVGWFLFGRACNITDYVLEPTVSQNLIGLTWLLFHALMAFFYSNDLLATTVEL
jgi:hypothetical protein